MLTLILVAFLAGVLTVASVCVLPVLPILLSTSAGGGKLRPLGIVVGFAASFTLFTLAVTAAAQAFAIPATWLRMVSIVALLVFGLVMLVPALSNAWERILSPLTRVVDTQPQRSGFGGGTLIGAGLGLLWSPCVGPIIGTVIFLTAASGITAQGLAITLSYALGSAVPMLLIGYGSRGLVSRARRVGRGSPIVQRLFGALTVLACAGLLLGWNARLQTLAQQNLPSEWSAALIAPEQQDSVQKEISNLESNTLPAVTQAVPTANTPADTPVPPTSVPATATPQPIIALKDLGPAPQFVGLTNWINSEPLTLASLKGKVVIIDFWTFECYNCRNTLPYVKSLYETYNRQGLEIVGVHAPEFAYERVPDNVRAAVKDQGITWPVALDQDFKTWGAYQNRYWPAFYFIDADGHLRYTHFGEGNYDTNEKVVQQLLMEAKAKSQSR